MSSVHVAAVVSSCCFSWPFRRWRFSAAAEGDDTASDQPGDGGDAARRDRALPRPARSSSVKRFLGEHMDRLAGFADEFDRLARRYAELAKAEGGENREALWARHADEVGPLLRRMKAAWVEGNPYYERVEGVVAGTPSLAEYDVIIDAGSSAAEDPESAVPFDLSCRTARCSSSRATSST